MQRFTSLVFLIILGAAMIGCTGDSEEVAKLQQQVAKLQEQAEVVERTIFKVTVQSGVTVYELRDGFSDHSVLREDIILLQQQLQNSGILQLPEVPEHWIGQTTPIELFLRGYLREQGFRSDIMPAWSIETDGIGTPRATSSSWGRFGSNVQMAKQLFDKGDYEGARTRTFAAIGELGLVSCGHVDIHVSTLALPQELIELVRADLEPRYVFGSDEHGHTLGYRAENPGC